MTAALDGLVFTPTPGQGGPGQTTSTTFTIEDTDSAGRAVTDSTTSVIATDSVLGNLGIDQQLELIYIAYFNRAADGGGNAFWSDQNTKAQAEGQSAATALTNIANSFAPQPETIALYPFLGTSDLDLNSPGTQSGLLNFVASVYQNLFDRAPDAAGQAVLGQPDYRGCG